MTVNLQTVKDALNEILVTVPEDYVYDMPRGNCVYVHQGAPSCLVGHVMAHLGLELPDEDSADNDTRLGRTSFRQLFDGDAYDLLQKVQDEQDASTAWHEAVKRAESPTEV